MISSLRDSAVSHWHRVWHRALIPTLLGMVMLHGAGPTFYVDPVKGSDGNVGTLEKPVKSIQKARDLVRPMLPSMKSDVIVYLRGGVYPISATVKKIPLMDNLKGQQVGTYDFRVGDLRFTEADAGRNGFQVVYKAWAEEKPVISGGMRVTGWTLHDKAKGIWKASLPPGTETRQFYVNDVRAVRARSENHFVRTVSFDKNTYSNGGPSHIVIPTALSTFRHPGELEFVFKEIWTLPRVGVERLERDGETVKVWLKQPGWHYAANRGGTSAKAPLWVENAYELLDEEGEWYLDRATSTLCYKPRPGEDLGNADCIIPVVDELMAITGSSLEALAGSMRFEGIRFIYTGWLRPNGLNGHSDAQDNYIREPAGKGNSDATPPAAISLRKTHRVHFERCVFSHLGINALEIMDASQDNLVQGCVFREISGGGIQVGDPQWRLPQDKVNFDPDDSRRLMRNNDILTCFFQRVAVEYKSATAISATYTVDMDVVHNEIMDVPYSGMHFGYSWAELQRTCTRGLRVAQNLVDGFMLELEDGGGIYFNGATGGTPEQPNLVVSNYVRRQGSPYFGSIYFDNGSSRYLAHDNVFDSVQSLYLVNRDNFIVELGRHWASGGESRILRVDPAAFQIKAEPPTLVQGGRWPAEALGVMNAAGLLPQYASLRPDYHQTERLIVEGTLNIQSGESRLIPVQAITRRGTRRQVEPSLLRWVSDNEKAASVDANGRLNARAHGLANLTCTMPSVPALPPVVVKVYVDDRLARLDPGAEHHQVRVGGVLRLKPMGLTALGATVPTEKLSFTAKNVDIAGIDSNGVITGFRKGRAAFSLTTMAQGKTLGAEVEIDVVDQPGTNPFRDWPYWLVSGTGSKRMGPEGLRLSTPAGFATYQGRRFQDEIFEFDLTIESQPGYWRGFSLRAQRDDTYVLGSDNAGYVFLVKATELELQRFTKGKRHWLVGGESGDPKKFLANTCIQYGRTHRIRFSAVDEAGGVRLALAVDGKPVFNVLDDDAGALRGPGYFGVTERSGTVVLKSVAGGTGNAPAAPAGDLPGETPASQGVVVGENFEQVASGSLPPGWTLTGDATAGVETLPGGGKCLRFEKRTATSNSPALAIPIPQTAGPVTFSMKMQAESTEPVLTLLLHDRTGHPYAYVNFGGGNISQVRVSGGKGSSVPLGKHTVAATPGNRWTELVLCVDFESQTFDAWVDGLATASKVGFWMEGKKSVETAKLTFIHYREHSGVFRVDDLVLRAGRHAPGGAPAHYNPDASPTVKDFGDPFKELLRVPAPRILRELGTGEGPGSVKTRRFTFAAPGHAGGSNEVYSAVASPSKPGPHPAILVLHGSGGSADVAHAETLAEMGYVAMAVDLPGIANPSNCPESRGAWMGHRFGSPGYISNRFTAAPDITASSIYQGEAAGLLAFNLLQTLPGVDAQHMGLIGVSYGGYSVTFLAGLLGDRVKATLSVYGCGFWDRGTVFWDQLLKMPEDERVVWMKWLDAGRRAPGITGAYYAAAAANDFFFWPPAIQATLDAIPGVKFHSYSPNVTHQVTVPGGKFEKVKNNWLGMEKAFFDFPLKGEGAPPPSLRINAAQIEGDGTCTVIWKAEGVGELGRAALFYSATNVPWTKRVWCTNEATRVSPGTFRASIPAVQVQSNVDFFVSTSDARPMTASSAIRAVR